MKFVRRIPVSRIAVTALLLISSSFLFSGCKYFDSPQNVFAPAGTVAADQKFLFFASMWPALGIMLLVELGLVYICVRYRRRPTDTGLPEQVHGNNMIEIIWTIIPAIMLAAFVPFVVGGIIDLGRTPKDALVVDVNGIQWAWGFSYTDPNGGPPIPGPFGTDVEQALHIPVGQAIELRLHSNNVIHSFWVPKLAGKTDVIPGRANHMWLRATETGTFSGQCAEFCGLQHADMRFTVIAESREDYDAYVKSLAAEARAGTTDELAQQQSGAR